MMRWIIVMVALGMVGMAWGEVVKRVQAPYTRPTLIAHRGASADAPEHTLEAYRLALQQGADFIEPDLQMTRDGELVCLHDLTLERTTNVAAVYPDRSRLVKGKKTWPVVEFTLEEIRKLDAGAWKGAKFRGARVPTFQEVIELVKGKAGLIPETKAPEVYRKHALKMEPRLMELLKKNGLERPGADPKTPVVIQSFSLASLRVLRQEHDCKLPLVYLLREGETSPKALRKIKEVADGIGPHKDLVRKQPELVKNAHALSMSVTVWTFRAGQTGMFRTVRDEMAYYLRELGVDAVFTDNPDQFPRD